MHRSARRLALSLVFSASMLALAVPTAVAHDSYGSSDGNWQGFSSAYDGYEHDGWGRDRSDRQGDRDAAAGRDADDRADGGNRDRRLDQGRSDSEPAGDRTDDGTDKGNGEKADDSADRRTGGRTEGQAGHRAGDRFVSPREQRARERAARRIRRAGIEMAFLQDQQMMVAHLERADAFLISLAERVGQADLDPAVKNALLGLIDERRATVAGLVEKVKAAETAQDLEEIRPATQDPVGAS